MQVRQYQLDVIVQTTADVLRCARKGHFPCPLLSDGKKPVAGRSQFRGCGAGPSANGNFHTQTTTILQRNHHHFSVLIAHIARAISRRFPRTRSCRPTASPGPTSRPTPAVPCVPRAAVAACCMTAWPRSCSCTWGRSCHTVGCLMAYRGPTRRSPPHRLSCGPVCQA